MSDADASSNPRNPARWICAVIAFAVFAATLGGLLATESDYGYAIDEATYRYVAAEIRAWFGDLGTKPLAESLSSKAISDRWHFLEAPGSRPGQPHSNFNLPASVHVLNLGWTLGGFRPHELARLRFGSEMLFAATTAAIFWTVARPRGLLVGLAAALAFVCSPRAFGHAHLAATETTLVCFWMLATLAFWRAAELQSRSRTLAAACFIGLLAATKLTGWLALPIFAAVAAWQRRWTLLAAVVLAPPIVIVALTPNLWHDPVNGLLACVKLAANNPWKIATYYMGETFAGALPWHSGLVTFATTMPIAWLVLGTQSRFAARRDRLVAILVFQGFGLLVCRIIGLVPGHDGERQFLPVLALLAVAGVVWIASLRIRLGWRSVLLILAFVEPAESLWQYRGLGLCYYNRLVGGPDGAAKLGLETSYWFEGLRAEDWQTLLAPLPAGSRVFLRPDHPGQRELAEWGWWPPHVKLADKPEDADYYLLYARRSAYWVQAEDGAMVRTDLANLLESAPGPEIRRHGIRLAVLVRRR